jgi:8-oxo-dGTP pyrophosphatase MutT (NUDIX family)
VSPEPPQVIPVPAVLTPGPAPPWAGRSISTLPLAGVALALTSSFDPSLRSDNPRASAVLGLLFEEDDNTRIVLTRRAATLRSHRSEVSFPGGRVEVGETLIDAALRETWEEVNIPPGDIEVIGTLMPLQTFSSNAYVSPYVGVLPGGRPSITANPAEVELAFDIALTSLLDLYRAELWGDRLMHFFDLPGDIVWGATGRLLWELLAKVSA